MRLKVMWMVLVLLLLGTAAQAKIVTQAVPYQHERFLQRDPRVK